MRAKLVFWQKHVYEDECIVEMKVWQVPKEPLRPEGYKYSLVYIDGAGKRVLGYDNAEGKGHHRHDRDKETTVHFETIEKLVETFQREVERLRRKK